jgi:hypothetical protein
MYLYTLKSINALSKKPHYLVGRTACIASSFLQHNNQEQACEYSKKWAPWVLLRIESTPRIHHFELMHYTLQHMQMFGVEAVRGGPWMQSNLTPRVVRDIQTILKSDVASACCPKQLC